MKTNTLKFISLVLLLAMLAIALVACETPGEGDESPFASETPTETEPVEVVEDINIVLDGKSSFTIVRPETATDYEKSCASAIRTMLHNECGAVVSIASDWINESAGMTENEYEILVGRTSREESQAIYLGLRVDDYSITVEGKKIVIAALTEEKLTEAVNYFIDSLEVSEGNAIFPGDKVKQMTGSYAVEKVTIGDILLSNYRIVYRNGASDSVRAAAARMAETLRQNYGYDLVIKTDDASEVDYEIIFGGTKRGNSTAEAEKLRALDYKIYAEGKKIYVVMGNDAADVAADAFLKMLDDAKANGKIEAKTDIFSLDYKSDEYKTGEILLNGTPIEEYTIIYSRTESGASFMAENLRNVIEEMCGRKLSMISDGRPATEGSKEIIIGYSSRIDETSVALRQAIRNVKSNEYLIYGEDGVVYVGGREGSAISLTAAVNALVKAIRTTGDSERVVLNYTDTAATKISGKTYSMMSYNDGDNSYKNVDDRMAVVQTYMPDILCFQETQVLHAKVYKARLEVYDYVYFDNDGTTYNSQPIYYKRDMFELLDSGIQWLSDTPDERSKYEESDYIRSFTYAVLRDKETGVEIVIVNTHIDYMSAATAKQTARLIELTEKFRDKPVFYFGDFNMQRGSAGYVNMVNAGLNDTGRALGNNQSVIDFCFFDRALALPSKYKIVNDHELSSVASDHPAIYSEVMVVA